MTSDSVGRDPVGVLRWLVGIVVVIACAMVAVAQDAAPIEIRRAGLVVVARHEGERALAERIAVLYAEVVGTCRLRIGRAPVGTVRVTLARLGGHGSHPGRTVGLAAWSSRWIQIDPDRLGPLSPLQAVLAHEVVHIVVGQASQGRVPTWFDEGVAEWVGSAYGIADRHSLAEAASRGALPTLESLADSFPSDARARQVAYAASRETVEIISGRAGAAAVSQTLANLAAGQPFREALTRASGHGPAHWNAALQAALAPGPGLVRRLFESNPDMTWWLILGAGSVLVVVGAIVRTRRARAKLEASEVADRIVDPDLAMLEHAAEHDEEEWEPEDDDESWRG